MPSGTMFEKLSSNTGVCLYSDPGDERPGKAPGVTTVPPAPGSVVGGVVRGSSMSAVAS
jgi:hypothetical protein